jgi:hypothetical protein
MSIPTAQAAHFCIHQPVSLPSPTDGYERKSWRLDRGICDAFHSPLNSRSAKSIKIAFRQFQRWNPVRDDGLTARHGAKAVFANSRRLRWASVEALCCGYWEFRFRSFCCWRCFGITDRSASNSNMQLRKQLPAHHRQHAKTGNHHNLA